MHPKANAKNYLWLCVVHYHNIPTEEYVRQYPPMWRSFRRERLSSQHWDLINHVHYYITRFWKMYPDSEIEDTIKKLEGARNWRGEFLHKNHPWSPWYRIRSKKWDNFIRSLWVGHSRHSRYRKKPHHRKKILSEGEEHKRAWRLKKKGKKHKPGRSRRKSCPKSYKKIGNGKHRQWERENINKGNWDVLSNQRKWKEALNPWDWD